MEQVRIEKLVHGGQGLGSLADGRRAFVWNALPGELVGVRVIKKKRNYVEAIAEEIVEASPRRQVPRESNYLATSPWQILDFASENQYKLEIVAELFAHEKVALPAELSETVHTDQEWHYRNKMEYSFWGDEQGLHLALHQRGSSNKQIIDGSALARPQIDVAAKALLAQLQLLDVRAGDLKTVIIRTDQLGNTALSLFVKRLDFHELSLPGGIRGIRVYYSNPKSPASVATELLQELGDAQLHDHLLGTQFVYDVDSFFQVNLPIFERALTDIKNYCDQDPVDMYSGVGSIGLSVSRQTATLVELDSASAAMARINLKASGLSGEVVEASTEKALEYITATQLVIFDPPRAGLHPKVTQRVLEVLPQKIIYLSCNPATHARDLALLQERYNIVDFKIYNFFPKTPHIETLAILNLKNG